MQQSREQEKRGMRVVHTADTHVHIKTKVCPERVFFLNLVISAVGCLVFQM